MSWGGQKETRPPFSLSSLFSGDSSWEIRAGEKEKEGKTEKKGKREGGTVLL